MTERQAFALAHPLGDYGPMARETLKPYRRVREHRRGWVMTILAVDR